MKSMTCGMSWTMALATMAVLAALGSTPALADGELPDPQQPPVPAVDPPFDGDECPDPAPEGLPGGTARLIATGVTLVVRLAAL